jgi:hypothetical protein
MRSDLSLGMAIIVQLITRHDWHMDNKQEIECYDAVEEVRKLLENMGAISTETKEDWQELQQLATSYIVGRFKYKRSPVPTQDNEK